MNKRQDKQGGWELISKSVLPRGQLQRLSRFDTTESKAKMLSKISMLGFDGSPVFFHRRGERLKIPRYQNTFRLEPFKAFHAAAVDKIIHDVMEIKLSAITSYQPDQMSKLCLEIANDVLKAVNKKDYDRFETMRKFTSD